MRRAGFSSTRIGFAPPRISPSAERISIQCGPGSSSVSSTTVIGSVPAGVVARTSPSTRTSNAGMAPVARLKNASWARTDSSNGSPGATTLGAKPCTPATRVPLTHERQDRQRPPLAGGVEIDVQRQRHPGARRARHQQALPAAARVAVGDGDRLARVDPARGDAEDQRRLGSPEPAVRAARHVDVGLERRVGVRRRDRHVAVPGGVVGLEGAVVDVEVPRHPEASAGRHRARAGGPRSGEWSGRSAPRTGRATRRSALRARRARRAA